MSTVPTPQAQTRVHIRWMIRRDMPEVLAIEHASFEFPWCEEEFLRVLRQRNCIGMVAECGERIVGFMIYELHRNRIHVLDFATHPEFRRHGVGRQMVTKLVGKLSTQRRNRIVFCVRETNLPAQFFFRVVGFRAGKSSASTFRTPARTATACSTISTSRSSTNACPSNRIAKQLGS